jgi:hypothetical protein
VGHCPAQVGTRQVFFVGGEAGVMHDAGNLVDLSCIVLGDETSK